MNMDELLLERLMSDETLKSHFFANVNGTLVFDKTKFAWVLESREFLPDSYTTVSYTHLKGRCYKSKDFLTPAFMNHFPVLSVNFTAGLNEFPRDGGK